MLIKGRSKWKTKMVWYGTIIEARIMRLFLRNHRFSVSTPPPDNFFLLFFRSFRSVIFNPERLHCMGIGDAPDYKWWTWASEKTEFVGEREGRSCKHRTAQMHENSGRFHTRIVGIFQSTQATRAIKSDYLMSNFISFCVQAIEPADLQRNALLPFLHVVVWASRGPVFRRTEESLCAQHNTPRVGSTAFYCIFLLGNVI